MSAFNTYRRELGLVSEVMSKSQEQELGPAIANGEQEAIDKLVLANLKYVVKVAKGYVGYGVELEDLVGAGNVGLVEAAILYDPSFNCKFIGYADSHIRKQIRWALNEGARDVAIPDYLMADVSKLSATTRELLGTLHRHPSDHELMDALGWNRSHLETVRASYATSVELDQPIIEDGSELHDIFSYGDEQDPLEAVHEEQNRKLVHELLAFLSSSQRTIVEMTYGINCEPTNGAEIARQLGVTRQAVNAQLSMAMKKLAGLGKRRKITEEAKKLAHS
jgi:RNA polymerase primary sigma factor